MTTTNAKQNLNATFQRIANEIHRFASRENAFSFASQPGKPMWVMLGDDGRYWVTTPANCARLERMGYEFAI